MDRLFKREIQLTLTKPSGLSQAEADSLGIGPVLARQTVIKDLRVTFSIEKNLKKEPNTCKISVFNLAPQSRALVQVKPLSILLEAGYDGQVKRIFQGDMRYSESTHLGVSWETAMQWADGDRAYRTARVTRAFKPGVSSRVMLGECCKALGIPMPASASARTELDTITEAGEALNGPAQVEFTRILAKHGLHWSIQDGKIQILRDGECLPTEALPVSQATGMIGKIEYGAPTKPGHPRLLKFKTLLYPEIVPGRKVQLTTSGSGINGIFLVHRVIHKGDTHGEEWESEVEAVQPGKGTNGVGGWVRNAY